MENRIGILRNAPIGIKLYSPVFGDCKLSRVIEDEMTIEYFDGKNPAYITLDKYGRFKEDGECIVFPSKYRQNWNGWQEWLFRDKASLGKAVTDLMGGTFIIINNSDNIKIADASGKEFTLESKELDKFRFATPEERSRYIECESKYNTKMEDYTNYTNPLSIEEQTLLENLINKLSVSGLRQYNTQVATILFKNGDFLSDDDLLKATTINSLKKHEDSKQEIEDNLRFLDEYVMEMQDMLRSHPIVTNLEKIREYIDIINTKISNLK